MLKGYPSTPREPQSVNPPHYWWWCWDCLIIVWWSTTHFRSDLNQKFCLANPKLPQLLGVAGPLCSQCTAWLHRTRKWLVLQRVVVKVWHSLNVEDLVKSPLSVHVCPGSRPVEVCNYGEGTTIQWNLSITTTFIMQSIACCSFSEVIDADWGWLVPHFVTLFVF